jgi:outer membrane protein assembly factor BamB
VTPQPPPPPAKKADPPAPKFPAAARWSITVDAAPVAPPIVIGGRVVLALRSGVLSARQVSDGADVWTVKLPVDQPPAADGDMIFVVTGGTLHALNGADGSTAWSVPIGQPSAPLLARGGWVISAGDGSVAARRGSDGETVWIKATGAVSQRAAIEGDILYVPLTEGRLLALDLETGTTRWDRPVGPAPTEPLAYADRIYLGSDNKRFMCLEAKSGAIDWQWEIGTRVIGPAAGDASRVYFTAMDNVLRALSRDHGGQRWKQRLAYRPTGGPVLMGSQVAVPGITSELSGFDVTSGKPTGKLTFPVQLAIGPSFVAPEGPDGTAAVVSITGGLTNQWTLSLSIAAPPPAAEPPPVPPVK